MAALLNMPYVPRTDDEIIAELKAWASRIPNPDVPYITSLCGTKMYSVNEIMRLVESGDPEVRSVVVDGTRRIGELQDTDPLEVLRRSA
jgi:hypothetical protein